MKTFLTAILIITTGMAYAQTNILLGYTNKGAVVGAGYTAANGAVIQGTFAASFVSSEVPTIAAISAGYELLLSHNDADNFTLTALAGVATLTYSDAGKYLGCVDKVSGIYTAELAKDWYMGRLYLTASHASAWYLGAGMKVFLNRH